MPVKLSPRLATAVPYVRPASLVADIGTDHAYLPIFLCESGILTVREGAVSAVAADINRGPVERARVHIAAAGLSDRIATAETDGLFGLDAYDPDDILIFGMGGELIASILAAAPWIRRVGKRLILQPMTHAEKLRAHLRETGWHIVGETLSREGERIYQTLCAEWDDGTPAPALTLAELAVGQAHWHCGAASDTASDTAADIAADTAADTAAQTALYIALIEKTIRIETAARDARRGAGQDTAASDALLASLAALRAGL